MSDDKHLEELAQTAYRAYGATTGFKNFLGEPMPEWDRLGDKIRTAWIAAARAAAAAALREMADRIDRGPTFPLPPSVISALVRERADDHVEGSTP